MFLLIYKILFISQLAWGIADEYPCDPKHKSLIEKYIKLYDKIPKWKKVKKKNIRRYLRTGSKNCVYSKKRYVEKFLFEQKSRIGVILPLTGKNSQLGRTVLDGMYKAITAHGFDPKNYIFIKDTKSDPSKAESLLAELVFNHEVDIIIGGLEKNSAKKLASWSQKLKLTTILLSPSNWVKKSNTTFHIFPDSKLMGQSLANYSVYKNYRRIAILEPQKQKPSQILNSFRKEALQAGIKIYQPMPYVRGNFDSINNVVKKIFKLNKENRRKEFQALYNEAKDLAKTKNEPFIPRSVVLPPIIEYDAILIADNFRMTKHILKIFKFHGVHKIPLIGIPQWRSKELLKENEPILDGAVFADFIGSYSNLPKPIKPGSGFLLKAKQVEDLDYRILGYRAATLSMKTITTNGSRKSLSNRLLSQNNYKQAWLPPGRSFNSNRIARFKTWLLEVNGKNIALYSNQL